MRIDHLHYGFKLEAQRVDSSDVQDFEPYEIDEYLNSAISLIIKERYGLVASKRAFETDSVRINQLATLHIKSPELQPELVPTLLEDGLYEVRLSDLGQDIDGQYFRYLFLTSGYVTARSGACTKKIDLKHKRSNSSNTIYNVSSYDWSRVKYSFGRSTFVHPPYKTPGSKQDPDETAQLEYLGRYNNDELYSLFLDTRDKSGTSQFSIDGICISYVKYPNRVFYGGYDHIDKQSKRTDPPIHCDMPDAFHDDIIRKAVRLATRDISSNYEAMLQDEVRDLQY